MLLDYCDFVFAYLYSHRCFAKITGQTIVKEFGRLAQLVRAPN